MKIQIRRNVFETNSSSMHSLVICDTDAINKEYQEVDIEYDSHYTHETMLEELKEEYPFNEKTGVLDFSEREWYFGRAPFRIFRQFGDKLQYFLASYYCFNREELDKAIALIKELVPEVKEIKIPKERSYSFSDYGYRNIDFDENYYFSWKDKYNFTDKEFLTSDEFVVIQDGDEYGKWMDCFDAGIVDGKIVKLDSHRQWEKEFLDNYRVEEDGED